MNRAVAIGCLLTIAAHTLQGQQVSSAGDLVMPRGFHTATLLLNGKVLIAGGTGSSAVLASAELYDPSTKKFTLTGSMAIPRSRHTATLLSNGKVLIAGGTTSTASLELYDPQSGTFSMTGPMSTPRLFQSANLLPDGEVLVAGGIDSTGATLASAEVYDPATGRFSSASNLTVARYLSLGVGLADGRILVTGGVRSQGQSTQTLPDAEIFDPTTKTFTPTGKMVVPRSAPCGTLLHDGRVIVIGGSIGSVAVNSGEIYDPQSGTFSFAGFVALPRRDATCTLLADGSVLFAGGNPTQTTYGATSALEIYDPVQQTFRAAGNLITARTYHSATLLGNGQVLIVGGYSGSSVLSSSELYGIARTRKRATPH